MSKAYGCCIFCLAKILAVLCMSFQHIGSCFLHCSMPYFVQQVLWLVSFITLPIYSFYPSEPTFINFINIIFIFNLCQSNINFRLTINYNLVALGHTNIVTWSRCPASLVEHGPLNWNTSQQPTCFGQKFQRSNNLLSYLPNKNLISSLKSPTKR